MATLQIFMAALQIFMVALQIFMVVLLIFMTVLLQIFMVAQASRLCGTKSIISRTGETPVPLFRRTTTLGI